MHPGYAYREWWERFPYPRRIIVVKKNDQELRAD